MVNWHGMKVIWVDRMLDPLWPWAMTLTLYFQGQILKSHILGIRWLIDMEQKGCESMRSWTHFVTLNFNLTNDLNLGFPRSNFEIAVSQEWEGWLTWNERDRRRLNVGPTIKLWIWVLTLTFDFQGQIFEMPYPRNGMANLNWTKWMWVDRKSDPLCEIWPDPWHSPWIFKVWFWKSCI